MCCCRALEYLRDTTSGSALRRQDSSKLRKRNPRSLSRETCWIAWILERVLPRTVACDTARWGLWVVLSDLFAGISPRISSKGSSAAVAVATSCCRVSDTAIFDSSHFCCEAFCKGSYMHSLASEFFTILSNRRAEPPQAPRNRFKQDPATPPTPAARELARNAGPPSFNDDPHQALHRFFVRLVVVRRPKGLARSLILRGTPLRKSSPACSQSGRQKHDARSNGRRQQTGAPSVHAFDGLFGPAAREIV
jgi:hypothetical protein